MISSEAENNVTKQNLTDARVKVNQKRHKLRDQLARDRLAARKQLTELTFQGDAAMKKLQAVITKVKPHTPVHPPSQLQLFPFIFCSVF